MSTQHLNIRREKAKAAAREMSEVMGVSISEAVELALVSTMARLRRDIEQGGDPALFVARLTIEGRDQQVAESTQ